jgi:hypothetical protein
MLVDRLRAEGIDAHGVEAFNIATETRTHLRILVRAADLAAATALVERWNPGSTRAR